MKKIFLFLFLISLHQSLLAQIYPDHNWVSGTLKEFDISEAPLSEMEVKIDVGDFGDIHSVIIVKNGKLVYENYFNGWNRDSLQQTQSVTKSVVSSYVGIAIQKGLIDDINKPVYPVFQNDFEIAELTEEKRKLSLADLMTMRAGFEWESRWVNPNNTWRKILDTPGNWYKMILDRPMAYSPGTYFQYHEGNPVLVAGYIQALAGEPIQEFARKNLFTPLQIERYRFWPGNGGPDQNGAVLLFMRPVDMAKFGYLYLNKGVWKGTRILPKWFVEESTSSIVKNAEDNPLYSSFDYGYYWWVNPQIRDKHIQKPEGTVYLARGTGGQNIIVWPEQNIVCVITAWNLQRPNFPQTIFDRFIVPAIQGITESR